MPSFPNATKKTYYEIDGKPYVKLGQREAVDKPDTIRAMLDDKLCWFAPDNQDFFFAEQTAAAKEADAKPKLAS